MLLSELTLVIDNSLHGGVTPDVFNTFLFPGCGSGRMSVEEVSSRINLHLVQLAHETEVHHGSYAFPGNYLGVTLVCIEGLYFTESRAYHRSSQ